MAETGGPKAVVVDHRKDMLLKDIRGVLRRGWEQAAIQLFVEVLLIGVWSVPEKEPDGCDNNKRMWLFGKGKLMWSFVGGWKQAAMQLFVEIPSADV